MARSRSVPLRPPVPSLDRSHQAIPPGIENPRPPACLGPSIYSPQLAGELLGRSVSAGTVAFKNPARLNWGNVGGCM